MDQLKIKSTIPVTEESETRSVGATGTSRLSTWGSVVGYCLLIFWLSSRTDLSLPKPVPYFDKLAHLVLYAGLGWLWTRAVKEIRPHWTPLAILLTTLLFTGGYGLSDEWHQSYVPGRFADLRDVFADAVGGVVGGHCYLLWQRKKRTGSEEEKSPRR